MSQSQSSTLNRTPNRNNAASSSSASNYLTNNKCNISTSMLGGSTGGGGNGSNTNGLSHALLQKRLSDLVHDENHHRSSLRTSTSSIHKHLPPLMSEAFSPSSPAEGFSANSPPARSTIGLGSPPLPPSHNHHLHHQPSKPDPSQGKGPAAISSSPQEVSFRKHSSFNIHLTDMPPVYPHSFTQKTNLTTLPSLSNSDSSSIEDSSSSNQPINSPTQYEALRKEAAIVDRLKSIPGYGSAFTKNDLYIANYNALNFVRPETYSQKREPAAVKYYRLSQKYMKAKREKLAASQMSKQSPTQPLDSQRSQGTQFPSAEIPSEPPKAPPAMISSQPMDDSASPPAGSDASQGIPLTRTNSKPVSALSAGLALNKAGSKPNSPLIPADQQEPTSALPSISFNQPSGLNIQGAGLSHLMPNLRDHRDDTLTPKPMFTASTQTTPYASPFMEITPTPNDQMERTPKISDTETNANSRLEVPRNQSSPALTSYSQSSSVSSSATGRVGVTAFQLAGRTSAKEQTPANPSIRPGASNQVRRTGSVMGLSTTNASPQPPPSLVPLSQSLHNESVSGSFSRSGSFVNSAFFEKVMSRRNSNVQINVIRKTGVDASPGNSPFPRSNAYPSINPSPAASFLSGLMVPAAALHQPGVYSEGDQIGEWLLLKEIGQGSFSKVFEAVPADPSQGTDRVAIKVIRKVDAESSPYGAGLQPSSSNASLTSAASSLQSGPKSPEIHDPNGANSTMEDIQRILDHETSIWSSLEHPNILTLHDVMEVDDAIFVVAELANAGTLLDYIAKAKAQARALGGSDSCQGSQSSLVGWGMMSSSFSNSPSQPSPKPPLDEKTAKEIFRQIASAVHYLHCVAGVVHRDIKCENILMVGPAKEKRRKSLGRSSTTESSMLSSITSDAGGVTMQISGERGKFDLAYDDDTDSVRGGDRRIDEDDEDDGDDQLEVPTPVPKLADFGLSDWMAGSPQGSSPPQSGGGAGGGTSNDPIFCVGSLHYCAPEELRQTHIKSPTSDVWSLGCVLFALLTGSMPFNDEFLPRLQMHIINGKYDSAKMERMGISPGAVRLVAGMLTVKVDKRLTIKEVCEHEWLQSD